MTPEGKVKKEIKEWLKAQGAYFFCPVQTGYGASTVDFLVCYKGKFVAIEAKAKGNYPTARQQLIMNEVRKAGGVAFAAWSLDDVKGMFE